jgi:non-specific serine/threonine protein kinase
LSALIDWSYDLLAPPEQRLFASLSIFAGGCTLSEATAVCGDEGSNDLDILDRLSSLVDKSLVIADRTTSEPRYQLLQTFQRYGAEKLAARGETWAIAHRHAHVYTTLAERLDDDYDVAPNAAWFARVEREIDNFESALDWTLQAGHDIVLGQRLAGALRPVWTVAEGGRRWVQLALDLLDERTSRPIAARLHFADMAFRSRAGEHAATVAACERLALA